MRGKLYDIITIFVRENFNELAKALDRADAANTEGTTSLEECLMREVLAATGAKAQRRKGADDLIGSARLVFKVGGADSSVRSAVCSGLLRSNASCCPNWPRR